MPSTDSPTLHAHRQALLALRQQVRIAHHLPGRIRIEIRQNGAVEPGNQSREHGHALAGGVFLVFLSRHLWVYRKRLLK